jgi:hypothetical protein
MPRCEIVRARRDRRVRRAGDDEQKNFDADEEGTNNYFIASSIRRV